MDPVTTWLKGAPEMEICCSFLESFELTLAATLCLGTDTSMLLRSVCAGGICYGDAEAQVALSIALSRVLRVS